MDLDLCQKVAHVEQRKGIYLGVILEAVAKEIGKDNLSMTKPCFGELFHVQVGVAF